ncbi:hypothetical protein O9992_14675 [Vibrio lentus]|nr:hypothetical protein [Vibrio lentus]
MTQSDEFGDLKKKIEDPKMPQEALRENRARTAKTEMMSPMSAEATVVRSRIDWMVGVPWPCSKVKKNLAKRKEV